MTIPRSVTRFIARLLVGVMVFAQLAVAAYACTGVSGPSMNGAGGIVVDTTGAGSAIAERVLGLAGHAAMDPAQPNLCAAHCQSGQQNAGAKSVPDLPTAMPVSLYPQASLSLPAELLRASAATRDSPPSADPPHTILHCCLRI